MVADEGPQQRDEESLLRVNQGRLMDLPVTRTYLEMRAAPAGERPAAPEGAHVERLEHCPPELYRQLYAEVGRQWSWFDRLWWSDAELAAHLGQPEVLIRVLHLNGAPAGYYELVSHGDRSVEIGYFGLMPHAIGKGLGRWLLGRRSPKPGACSLTASGCTPARWTTRPPCPTT